MRHIAYIPSESDVLELGVGHNHPVHPYLDAQHDFDDFSSKYRYLANHFDYLSFVSQYCGAKYYSSTRGDGSFLFVVIYGIGKWAFEDECPEPITQTHYHVFSVVEFRSSAPDTDGRSPPDTITSFAFDTRGRSGVYSETHSAGDPDSSFGLYCPSFREWVEDLSRLIAKPMRWMDK